MTELGKITYDLALYGNKLADFAYNTQDKKVQKIIKSFDKTYVKYVNWKGKQ